jgi:hypothetical protein
MPGDERSSVTSRNQLDNRLPVLARVTMLKSCSSYPKRKPPRSRAAFEQQGKLSAAVELRRLFAGTIDNLRA